MHSKHRLRSNADFRRIRSEGRSLVHPLLVISTLPNGLQYSRFGFAVGRRIGKAAERNRVKRRMRESVRIKLQKGEIAGGWDVVVIARHPVHQATFRQVDEAIGVILGRAGLMVP
jgi:ribonuclease P protein component